MAPYAPRMARPVSCLTARYGPAIVPQELGAENGLFQPNLTMAQKTPKLTPRPGYTRAGARQATRSPLIRN